MTDQRAVLLGGILKRIDSFDMNNFESRLLLQKRTYFLQTFGIYMGYAYSWYIYGPYSVQLARDGFAVAPIVNNIPKIKFVKEEHEKTFQQFADFLGERKDDANWLERLASIHFLKKIYPSLTKSNIVERVRHKQTYFTKKQCLEAWDYLHNYNLLK